jgi:hypothetical protein
MRKFEIEHLTNRITQVIQCTKGTISTFINAKSKPIAYTQQERLELIRAGKGILKSNTELKDGNGSYASDSMAVLIRCYEFPETATQKANKAFNKRLVAKKDDIWAAIDTASKRLLDNAVLGLIPIESLPHELEKLNEMSELIK